MSIEYDVLEFESVTAISGAKNSIVETKTETKDSPLRREYVTSLTEALRVVGLPFVTANDKVLIRAKRKSSHTRTRTHYSNVQTFGTKSRNGIQLGSNLKGVLNVVKKYPYIDSFGSQKIGYEYQSNFDNITVYVRANSIDISVGKLYVCGMTYNGAVYRNLYALFLAVVYDLMYCGVIVYRGKDIYSRSAYECARYHLKKFNLSGMEVCTLFSSDLSLSLFNDLRKYGVSSQKNTIYFQSNMKRKTGEKVYIVEDERESGVLMVKHELTFDSETLKRKDVSLYSLKSVTGYGTIPEGIENMTMKKLNNTLSKSPNARSKVMSAKVKKPNTAFTMNYLMSEVASLNRRMSNIERIAEKNSRDIAELKSQRQNAPFAVTKN